MAECADTGYLPPVNSVCASGQCLKNKEQGCRADDINQYVALTKINATDGAGVVKKAKAADKKSEAEMHVHERWALATTLLQIAIALSAITLLTRKRWLLIGVYGSTALGLAAGVMGYLHL